MLLLDARCQSKKKSEYVECIIYIVTFGHTVVKKYSFYRQYSGCDIADTENAEFWNLFHKRV